MLHWLAINKSDSPFPVYDTIQCQNRIGTIYVREAFGADFYGGCGERPITFRNSSGYVVTGYVNTADMSNVNLAGYGCEGYPYESGIQIGSGTYYTFMFRNTENIYRPDGNYWGRVAAGRRVATTNSDTGDTHLDWKAINYVERSDGTWIPVADSWYDHGYVNVGLDKGSMPDSISMYGSW